MTNEYKVLRVMTKQTWWGDAESPDSELEEKLNTLAAQGWEMVSMIPITQGYGTTRMITVVLKREKK